MHAKLCFDVQQLHGSGTDQMDENIARHGIGVCGKKSWWSLFTRLIDVTDSWRLCVNSGHNVTQLELFFRSILFDSKMLQTEKAEKGAFAMTAWTITTSHRLLMAKEKDAPEKRVLLQLENNVSPKCDVGLCVYCFKIFHFKQFFIIFFVFFIKRNYTSKKKCHVLKM